MKKLFFNKSNTEAKGHTLKKERGFTLVETLVAIAIFTLAIIALMSVLGSGVSDTNYAKKKMTATYLAQEGIEYIRNMRDDYSLYEISTGHNWEEFMDKIVTACATSAGCYFQDADLYSSDYMTDVSLNPCTGTACYLYYSSDTSRYSYDNSEGEITDFQRIIKVETGSSTAPFNSGQEIKVISTVKWTQGSGNYSISFSENLFNWTP